MVPTASSDRPRAGGCHPSGLAGAGCTLDDGDGFGVGAGEDPVDDLVLDGQHLGRGESGDVLGLVGAAEQWLRCGDDASGQIFGQLDTNGWVRDSTARGDDPLDLAPGVGSVPR
jgi:hypothetical protein